MSRNFLDLKRDIQYFMDRFGKWVTEKGFVVDIITSILKSMIDAIQRDIEKYAFEFVIRITIPQICFIAVALMRRYHFDISIRSTRTYL